MKNTKVKNGKRHGSGTSLKPMIYSVQIVALMMYNKFKTDESHG